MRKIALNTIKFYQHAVSPMLGPRCRFYPSCSKYAHEAISVHGLAKGSWLSITRIGKCHPFHPGGIDLVPSGTDKSQEGMLNG